MPYRESFILALCFVGVIIMLVALIGYVAITGELPDGTCANL